MSSLKKPLLILDMDETILHTREEPLTDRPADFMLLGNHVYLRPFLSDFLERVWRLYDVAVWSAGGSLYVLPAIELAMEGFPEPLFIWTANRCTSRFDHETGRRYIIKDLKKVRKRGFPIERVLIVDDTRINAMRNYGSAIYVEPYECQEDDCELALLAAYLESLASEPNFRVIEKRWWREQVG